MPEEFKEKPFNPLLPASTASVLRVLKSLFVFLVEQPSQLKYIEWPSFSSAYHPDMNKSLEAKEKFKEISAAYEVDPLDLVDGSLVLQMDFLEKVVMEASISTLEAIETMVLIFGS